MVSLVLEAWNEASQSILILSSPWPQTVAPVGSPPNVKTNSQFTRPGVPNAWGSDGFGDY